MLSNILKLFIIHQMMIFVVTSLQRKISMWLKRKINTCNKTNYKYLNNLLFEANVMQENLIKKLELLIFQIYIVGWNWRWWAANCCCNQGIAWRNRGSISRSYCWGSYLFLCYFTFKWNIRTHKFALLRRYATYPAHMHNF